MTDVQNTAEGQTSGTTVTAGNSGGGSGDAFSSISSTSTTCIFSNLWSAFGTQSYRITAANTFACNMIMNTAGSGFSASLRYYFNMPTLPTGGDTVIFQFRNSGGNAMYCQVSTAGQLKIGNTAATVLSMTGQVITANTDYWIEASVTAATSTTGVAKITLHADDGSNTVVGTPYSVTNFNAGTTAITNVRVGKPNSANALDQFIDQIRMVDTSNTLLGPYVPPSTPPNASGIGFANYYSFDATTSDAGMGGTLTYTIAQNSGPSFTALEPSDGLFLVERDSTTDRVYTVTATESPSGLTDTIQFTAPAVIITVGSNDLVWTGSEFE